MGLSGSENQFWSSSYVDALIFFICLSDRVTIAWSWVTNRQIEHCHDPRVGQRFACSSYFPFEIHRQE